MVQVSAQLLRLPSYAREVGGLVPLSEVWTLSNSRRDRLQASLQEVHGDEPGGTRGIAGAPAQT